MLIAGGSDSTAAELYDPATGLFTTTGSIATLRFNHTATLLNDGKVLVTGGNNLASAELYDPVTGAFAAVGNMTTPRSHHRATLLNDGTVLVTGGSNSSCCVAGADLYDPGARAFTATGAMISGRDGHTATLLTNGQVLVTGGEDFTGPLSSAEKYDPIPRTFAVTGDMNVEHAVGSRVGHTATRLNTGEVLVGGGTVGVAVNSTAETYQPSTLAPPGLTSIAVTPGSASISVGSTQRFIALGTFSGGSTQTLASVVWTSSDPAVAGISNDAGSQGIGIGRQAGIAAVRASTGGISDVATLTVQ